MVDVVQHAINRGNLQGQISDCTRCHLRDNAIAPVVFRGKTPNRLMILGEAPGKMEDSIGRPFVGGSSKTITRLMRDANLPPLDDWFLANTVCCRSLGPPDKIALKACSDNLRAQVKLCNPEWVLLLGATALNSTGYLKGNMTKIHGRPWLAEAGPFKDILCFPTFHPAAGLRDDRRLVDIAEDLCILGKMINGQVDVDNLLFKVGRGGKKPVRR